MSIYKKIILSFIVGSSIFLGYYFLDKPPETTRSLDTTPHGVLKVVETVTVTLKPIQHSVQLIGKIQSQQATTLIAQSTGIITIITPAGKMVKKGEPIAKINDFNIERNYQLAQQAEKLAKLQYQRVQRLLEEGILGKHAVEEKENAWIRSQETLSEEKIGLDKLMIIAPFDGVVGAFKFRPNSQVQSGETVVPLYDSSKLVVEFDIPFPLVSTLHNGSVVIINDKEYALTHLQQMLDDETHTSPAAVEIECRQCFIGSSIAVKLVVKNKKAAIVIPYESVFIRDGKQFVYKVQQGKTVLSAVTLGIKEQESVEIISGLKEKDIIIVRGQARLYPGERVAFS